MLKILSDLNSINGYLPSSVPDLSILSWKLDISGLNSCNETSNNSDRSLISVSYEKFNLRNLPENFMKNDQVMNQLHDAVFNLGKRLRCQHDTDTAYSEICSVYKKGNVW